MDTIVTIFQEAQTVLVLRITESAKKLQDRLACLRYLATHTVEVGLTGTVGADGIRAYIGKGVPPPNSPITLSGGWMRNPVSGKPVRVKGKSGTTPLVDTGQLYNDFDFTIAVTKG